MCSTTNPECVLPSGATMTGDWSFLTPSAGQEERVFASISFPLQAVPAPEYSLPGATVKWIGLAPDGEYDRTDCPGTAEDPEALPGFLCIYAAEFYNAEGFPTTGSLFGNFTADTNSGLTMVFTLQNSSTEAYGFGSWAYTAE